MLTATRRRFRAPALLVLAMIVGLPAMAQAQLFPNRTIKRQRETCAAESPFNAHVRKDYFGYYPTCWSKFPEGWGCPCPNPELPNAAASFQKHPRDTPPSLDRDRAGDPADADGRGMDGNPGPAADPNLPAIPQTNGRSPYDIDPPTPDTAPKAPGVGPRSANPGENPSIPAGRGPQTSRLDELPAIAAPSATVNAAGSIVMAPEAILTSNSGPSRPDLGPLPSAPMPSGSNPGDSEVVMGAPIPAGVPTAAPAQAPKRRSILGGLFGQGNKRVR